MEAGKGGGRESGDGANEGDPPLEPFLLLES